ncbi:MAG: hypothetical protein ACRDRL_08455 [Sciscionella sp.]
MSLLAIRLSALHASPTTARMLTQQLGVFIRRMLDQRYATAVASGPVGTVAAGDSPGISIAASQGKTNAMITRLQVAALPLVAAAMRATSYPAPIGDGMGTAPSSISYSAPPA